VILRPAFVNGCLLACLLTASPIAMADVVAGAAHRTDPMPESPASALAAIAHDIALLANDYPQLRAFATATHFDAEALRIDYAWRTHPAAHAGGWTAGVPNPDDDGVWFHLDLHDPASTAQIHTQPMTGPPQCLGDQRVAFLILEGAKTPPVGGAIGDVLRRHGVVACPPGA
jgi:hypothetical protein